MALVEHFCEAEASVPFAYQIPDEATKILIENRGYGIDPYIGVFIVPTIDFVTVHVEGDYFIESFCASGSTFFYFDTLYFFDDEAIQSVIRDMNLTIRTSRTLKEDGTVIDSDYTDIPVVATDDVTTTRVVPVSFTSYQTGETIEGVVSIHNNHTIEIIGNKQLHKISEICSTTFNREEIWTDSGHTYIGIYHAEWTDGYGVTWWKRGDAHFSRPSITFASSHTSPRKVYIEILVPNSETVSEIVKQFLTIRNHEPRWPHVNYSCYEDFIRIDSIVKKTGQFYSLPVDVPDTYGIWVHVFSDPWRFEIPTHELKTCSANFVLPNESEVPLT